MSRYIWRQIVQSINPRWTILITIKTNFYKSEFNYYPLFINQAVFDRLRLIVCFLEIFILALKSALNWKFRKISWKVSSIARANLVGFFLLLHPALSESGTYLKWHLLTILTCWKSIFELKSSKVKKHCLKPETERLKYKYVLIRFWLLRFWHLYYV